MTVIAYLPVLAFVIGLLLYIFGDGRVGRWAEIGRIMFFCGLLAFLMGQGAQSCTLGTGTAQHR
jgi:hypothetical protein